MFLNPPQLSLVPSLTFTHGALTDEAYITAVMEKSPSRFWIGDDASGGFVDVVAGRNLGIVSGSPSYRSTELIAGGKKVASGVFEALSTPRPTVSGGSAPHTFTMEALVNISAITSGVIFSLGAVARNNVSMYIATPSGSAAGKRLHMLFGGVLFNDTGKDLVLGAKTHIVMRRDSSGSNTCFVNGYETGFFSNATPSGVEDFAEVCGLLNEVGGYYSLYNSVLTAAQIRNNAAAAGCYEPNPLEAAMLADGALGIWKLDEPAGSTRAIDATGRIRNGYYPSSGTYMNFASVGGESPIVPGSARSTMFDASNDFVEGMGPSGEWALTTTCFEAVVKPAHITAGVQGICHTSDNTTWNYYLRLNAGLLQFGYRSGGVEKSINGPTLSAGTKYHIVAGTDGAGNSKIYVNGTPFTGSPGGTPDTTGRSLRIGSCFGANASQWPFDGIISHFGVYSSLLTPVKAAAHAALA